MDFSLYRSIIRQLDHPEIIRLNYSGESLFYPRLAEAVRLAAGTGAVTELVSTFIGVSEDRITRLILSGLDRLTVSLHAMTPDVFRDIYRTDAIDSLKRTIETFLRIRENEKMETPRLDVAFVAMNRNLAELEKVASYAADSGCRDMFIHPVIRRDSIPARFTHELKGQRLTDTFKEELYEAVEKARQKHPELAFSLSTPELGPAGRLHRFPAFFPGPLPKGGCIHTCDQNPWETIHILADGSAVVCECLDRHYMGKLTPQTSLADIWHGRRYDSFRSRYQRGRITECRTCPYKMAYRPGRISAAVTAADGASPQLLRGWHTSGDDGEIIWSKKTAEILLKRPMRSRQVRIRGILPHSAGCPPNSIRIKADSKTIGRISSSTDEALSFDETFLIGPSFFHRQMILSFETAHAFRPCETNQGNDTRQLGFALISAEVI